MSKFIVTTQTIEALKDAGLLGEDPNDVTRVIIDLEVGHAGRIYVDKMADDSIVDLIAGVAAGIGIVERNR